jgi:hypothetical protein
MMLPPSSENTTCESNEEDQPGEATGTESDDVIRLILIGLLDVPLAPTVSPE